MSFLETDTGNAAGEAVFYLGGLFAVDANGVPTDALAYTFQPVKNNIIGVTITLDPEYLAAADRAFPVVIDPTVMISSSSTADACVCSFTPSTNYQMATQLRTGYDTDYGIRRSYIRFSIPDSIEVGSVTSAYLDIEKISGVAPTMRAYRVTGSWSSGTITWNNKPGYTTTHQSTQSVPYSSGSSWYRMNVTSIVNAWVNGQYINYGFALVDSVENDSDHWTTLYSSDADSPHKPELYITYDVPSTASGAVLVGVTATGHDHSTSLTTVKSILENCGYSATKYTGAFTIATISSYMTTSSNSIFVSRSHGGCVYDDTWGVVNTYLCLEDDIYGIRYFCDQNLPSNLSNMDIMVFLACHSGEGGVGAENFPTLAHRKGAGAAIGFEGQISCALAGEWIVEFFSLLNSGYTVGYVCEYLSGQPKYSLDPLSDPVFCGNEALTIK